LWKKQMEEMGQSRNSKAKSLCQGSTKYCTTQFLLTTSKGTDTWFKSLNLIFFTCMNPFVYAYGCKRNHIFRTYSKALKPRSYVVHW
jgi:hypothetical protein